MYCVQCGVELAASEKVCPLCGTPVWTGHGFVNQAEGEGEGENAESAAASLLYPAAKPEKIESARPWIMLALTVSYVLSMVTLMCVDFSLNAAMTWSAYALTSMVCFYVLALLPNWWKHPNPVIFTGADGVSILLLAGFICLINKGTWFMPFAFPVIGTATLGATTIAALVHYVKRGYLYIIGGAFIFMGCLCMLINFMLPLAFPEIEFYFWAIYPLIICAAIGLFCLFIAIVKPVQRNLKKKFFL